MEIKCENCGKHYSKTESNAGLKNKYCSHKCEREVLKIGMSIPGTIKNGIELTKEAKKAGIFDSLSSKSVSESAKSVSESAKSVSESSDSASESSKSASESASSVAETLFEFGID